MNVPITIRREQRYSVQYEGFRPGVFDRVTGEFVDICESRAEAQTWVDRLNTQGVVEALIAIDIDDKACESCESPATVRTSVYYSPFDDTPDLVLQCERHAEDLDSEVLTCDSCQRTISRGTGWHVHYREQVDSTGDLTGFICLRCYTDDLLDNGHDVDELVRALKYGNVPGAFFNEGDLEQQGWTAVPDAPTFIRDAERARELVRLALQRIEAGAKVIIAYESLAIGGGEGFVTLYEKGGSE